MLNDYLLNSCNLKEVTQFLFSDNYLGQNKNQTLSRYLLFLTDSGKFEKIQHFFTVRGHSFLPRDRDFGIISRRLKKHDRFYLLREVIELILKSEKPGKFEVKKLKAVNI